MVKNKDKIASQQATELEVIEQKKKEENEKKNILEKAKAKMTAALNKDAETRKVKELKAKALKKVSVPSKPPATHLLGISNKKS